MTFEEWWHGATKDYPLLHVVETGAKAWAHEAWAAAVLAERERCAKLVRDREQAWWDYDDMQEAWEMIAAAILEQP